MDAVPGDNPAPRQPAPFRIPWARPFIDEEEIRAVVALLEDRRLSMGAEIQAFEREAAELVGRRYAVAVCNGTLALDLALSLLGIVDGDEVLVSALSFIATTNSIVRRGAVPVFCEVDPVTLNLDADDASRRLTGRTKAVLHADYCGMPADYDRLRRLCDEAGVVLLVDGAQSLLSEFRGTPACAIGLAATTSFHTAKPVLTGEGGMLFTDDDGLAELARRVRGQGEIAGRKYVHDLLAGNYRLTEIAAAIGRKQLARVGEIRARRRAIGERYLDGLGPLAGVQLVPHLPGCESAWFTFPIRIPNRDAVAALLAEQGIETRSLYPLPAYRQPIPEYGSFRSERRPNAEAACAEVLNLPVYYEMTESEVDDVVDALGRALASERRNGSPTHVEAQGRA